jgi:hypothetical protein
MNPGSPLRSGRDDEGRGAPATMPWIGRSGHSGRLRTPHPGLDPEAMAASAMLELLTIDGVMAPDIEQENLLPLDL